MNIAIDVSPLKSGNFLQHRVRGTGFYVENLKNSLLKYFPDNNYTFFSNKEKLPNNIDLVHYPYFEPFFLTLPFSYKHKTIITIHDLTPLVFPSFFPKGLKGNIKWQIQKLRAGKADAIITDSQSSKRDIIKFTGISKDKIDVVYLAAEDVFKPETNMLLRRRMRVKYKLPQKFVLYVGDVTWNKNLPRLVAATQKNNIPLVMVGGALINKDVDLNNPWNKDLVQVRKLTNDDKNIIRLGFISKEELVLIYNMAYVFVMPSLYEGFGLPILEAMKCGCPVVTSKEGSIPEVAGDAGLYVNAYDINDIALGIITMYQSEKIRKEYSLRGLTQAKKFSWKKTATETIKTYEK